jgi:hypothetical protein
VRCHNAVFDQTQHSAAIDAMGLVEDPSAEKLLIIYLRYTGLPEISEIVTVENAFVFSLEEASTMVYFCLYLSAYTG